MTHPGRPKRLNGYSYSSPGAVFHVRCGTLDRAPALRSEAAATVVVDALRFYQQRGVNVLCFCVMPDHAHVLCSFEVDGRDLSRWVGDVKRWTTRRLRELHQDEIRWQPGFFEHVLRRDENLRAVSLYILNNPVRAGLVTDWRSWPWCGSLVWELR